MKTHAEAGGIHRDDERWMRLALRLARLGEGKTRPNPPVGAVVVKSGRPVGRGFHPRAGDPHAEVFALRQAGRRASGATLYVTLEPCSTWGRTPPCTDAILRSGVAAVVYGVEDPNPMHRGRAARVLKRAGIDVRSGVLREAGTRLIEPFAKWVTSGRPFVTLKLGVSADGRIADCGGRSRWITGAPARALVQELRQRADAVMVGAGTVCADDPSLLPGGRPDDRLYRVVLDTVGRCPVDARIFTDRQANRTVIATSKGCASRRGAAYAANGANVWRLPLVGGRTSLRQVMAQMAKLGILHVLCEGGGELAAGLIAAGLVDEYLLFMAPMIIGGGGIPAVGGAGWRLTVAPRLEFLEVRRVGTDLMIRARPAMRAVR